MATLRTGQSTDFSSQTLTAVSSSDFYSVDSKASDSPSSQNESYYTPSWSKWNGYYRAIPEMRAVIDKLASWTFGRGIKADKKNKDKLKKLRGNGKESARLILKNQWRTALICGDSFAEIIKDNQGRIINLKPLNPETIQIIYNRKGMIEGYNQLTTEKKNREKPDFSEEEIYHLANERIGDEKGGMPFPEALEIMIKARNEALEDLRVLYHRNIKPIHWIEVETDDTTKLSLIETSVNNAYKKTENIIIPSGVIKEIKTQKSPQYSTLESLPYIKFLVRLFVSSCGVPEIVMGWGEQTTEASAKIIYLAFQQTIEDMQLYNQEMAELQLNITFDLEFPASIETEMQRDEKKDGPVSSTGDKETEVNMKGVK
jgi:predicted DNA-binding protein (MmcQ/YjbR family)